MQIIGFGKIYSHFLHRHPTKQTKFHNKDSIKHSFTHKISHLQSFYTNQTSKITAQKKRASDLKSDTREF